MAAVVLLAEKDGTKIEKTSFTLKMLKKPLAVLSINLVKVDCRLFQEEMAVVEVLNCLTSM